MRGKLEVERRRVLNHNPNTGSYWVVSNGTALRESMKNIDLLKSEMCLAQRRATAAARLLKERQPISVNKTHKPLTHKSLQQGSRRKDDSKKWELKGEKERKRTLRKCRSMLSERKWMSFEEDFILKYSAIPADPISNYFLRTSSVYEPNLQHKPAGSIFSLCNLHWIWKNYHVMYIELLDTSYMEIRDVQIYRLVVFMKRRNKMHF